MTFDTQLLIIGLGALVGLGIFCAIIFAIGDEPGAEDATPRRRRQVDGKDVLIRGALAAFVFLLVMILTGWYVLAFALAALAFFWNKMFGGSAEERKSIERIEGLTAWTESLRDTIAGAVGLEQAIPATAMNAAPTVRPSLNLLVDRMRVREPLPDALMKFADDLDDPSADLIVASLVLNSRLRGPGLRDVLSALAESSREELDMRRRIEGTRRATRRSVQLVVGITLSVAALLTVFNQEYLAPYDMALGQLLLLIVIALFGLGVLWLRKLAGFQEPERFLVASAHTRRTRALESVEQEVRR